MWLELILRWLHIFSAITLAGGLFFMRFALSPSLAKLAPGPAHEIRTALRGYWSRCVMLTSTLLLLTGLFNAFRIIKAHELPGIYAGMVIVKLLVGGAIFWLAAVLAGKSEMAQRFREQEGKWQTIVVLLVVVVVGTAGAMNVISGQAPAKNSTNVSSPTLPEQ